MATRAHAEKLYGVAPPGSNPRTLLGVPAMHLRANCFMLSNLAIPPAPSLKSARDTLSALVSRLQAHRPRVQPGAKPEVEGVQIGRHATGAP